MNANYTITAMVVLLAALIKGSTGFGFSMTALPLLIFQYTVKTVVPIIAIWSLTTSLIIILQKKEFKVDQENCGVIFWGALGTITGTLILSNFEEKALTLIVAVIFACLTTLSLAGFQFKIKNKRTATIQTGLLSGILAGSIFISGPPITLFLNALGIRKEEFREIFARFDIVTSIVALIGFSFAGYLNSQTFLFALIFVPVIYSGTYLGKKINHLIPQKIFRTVNLALSLISCLLLVFKNI